MSHTDRLAPAGAAAAQPLRRNRSAARPQRRGSAIPALMLACVAAAGVTGTSPQLRERMLPSTASSVPAAPVANHHEAELCPG